VKRETEVRHESAGDPKTTDYRVFLVLWTIGIFLSLVELGIVIGKQLARGNIFVASVTRCTKLFCDRPWARSLDRRHSDVSERSVAGD
jgi:hypothetical protein